jgi:hypothetical protein
MVSFWLLTMAAQVQPTSGLVGFVVDKVALVQVYSEYSSFPCQLLIHCLLHTHHHLSSGAVTVGQTAADAPSELSLTAPQEMIIIKIHLALPS